MDPTEVTLKKTTAFPVRYTVYALSITGFILPPVLDKRPAGSKLSMYEEDYEWMNHSLNPSRINGSDVRS